MTCIWFSQETGQVIWYSHLFQTFPQFIVIHTVKGFGIVNKAEIDIFLKLCCFFDDPVGIGNLISGSSALFKTSLNIWKSWTRVSEIHNLGRVPSWISCSYQTVKSTFTECPGTIISKVGSPLAFLGCTNRSSYIKVKEVLLEGIYRPHSRKNEWKYHWWSCAGVLIRGLRLSQSDTSKQVVEQ